ncbi:Hypothetical protein CINCED_3A017279 [Cinara cedri]|uniref:Mos1 transposase HTH domain-containing protein n=1 Tax=Cinara cedri TaxID=506608 RepID=A0A5E4NJQ5_9HEMI|nr:Hypothetical protein CINCED_3A017279 [Cinara cedri]
MARSCDPAGLRSGRVDSLMWGQLRREQVDDIRAKWLCATSQNATFPRILAGLSNGRGSRDGGRGIFGTRDSPAGDCDDDDDDDNCVCDLRAYPPLRHAAFVPSALPRLPESLALSDVKLPPSSTECYKLLQEAYGGNSLSRARVFEWYKRFSEGRESTEDDQRPGHPVTLSTPERVTKINQIVRADRRMSIRMIAEAVNADKETVRKILHEDLHMTKVCASWCQKT